MTPAWPILRDAKREEQEQQRANRELIAAAPDLLAACERALECLIMDEEDDLTACLRAAIRKATGGAA